jgi:hypothetical protein
MSVINQIVLDLDKNPPYNHLVDLELQDRRLPSQSRQTSLLSPKVLPLSWFRKNLEDWSNFFLYPALYQGPCRLDESVERMVFELALSPYICHFRL